MDIHTYKFEAILEILNYQLAFFVLLFAGYTCTLHRDLSLAFFPFYYVHIIIIIITINFIFLFHLANQNISRYLDYKRKGNTTLKKKKQKKGT